MKTVEKSLFRAATARKACYRFVLFALLAVQQVNTIGQDIHFSQFFEAPLLRNPSLAGIYEGDIRLQAVYKNQWNSISPTAYRTVSFNGEYKMPVGLTMDFFTIGGQILYDKAGAAGLTTTQLLPAVNYHKSLSNNRTSYLSVGFMGGWVQKRIDHSKITTNNQYSGGAYNPSLPSGERFPSNRLGHWDASAGISFNTAFGGDDEYLFFAGAAYHHFNRPKNSFYRDATIGLYEKYTLSGGLKAEIDEFRSITVQADWFRQGNYQEVIGGALYTVKLGDFPDEPLYVLHFGLFTRLKDALIPVIKIDKLPLSITLSYDVNTSLLKTASQARGGFELGLSYKAFLDYYNTSRDKVICPRF